MARGITVSILKNEFEHEDLCACACLYMKICKHEDLYSMHVPNS